MIFETKAIQPKAASASSIYLAIIVSALAKASGNFDYVQFYCPDVMSGSPKDALNSFSNWVEVPRIQVSGIIQDSDEEIVITNNFKVGGLIQISFQDGNLNSPQFVRYIEVPDYIIQKNKAYIDGVPITNDSVLFDLLDSDITLETDGIQKGLQLLESLKACSGYFHTFGSNTNIIGSSNINYVDIYRCSICCLEYISKSGSPDSNFSLLDTDSYTANLSPLKVCQSLLNYEMSGKLQTSITDVFNSVIKELEPNCETKFDKNNELHIVYLYTILSGYNFNTNTNDDSSKLYPKANEEFTSSIRKQFFNKTLKNINECLNYLSGDFPTFNTKLYIQNVISEFSDGVYSTQVKYDLDFIRRVWAKINSNSDFTNILYTQYAKILNNNLVNLRDHYGVSSFTNKALLVCVLLASAFLSICPIIMNFEYYADLISSLGSDVKTFIEDLQSCLKDSSKQFSYSADDIAKHFTQIYFKNLGLPLNTDSQKIWYNIPGTGDYASSVNPNTQPEQVIQQQMKTGIQHLFNNYDKMIGVLSANEGSLGSVQQTQYENTQLNFIWPLANSTNITSLYGNRTINGVTKMHKGIDIGANDGEDVLAVKSGIVTSISTTSESGGYGNCVEIQHADGVSGDVRTFYAHLKDYTVNLNDTVTQGQVIGHADNTGNSTGSHLHFEVRINGSTQDPSNYISSIVTKGNLPTTNTSNRQSTTTLGSWQIKPASGYFNVSMPKEHQDYVFKWCDSYMIPYPLMMGLIKQESGFNQNAVGQDGQDRGYCQIRTVNDDNLKRTFIGKNYGPNFSTFDIFNAEQNIAYGCYILGCQLELYYNCYTNKFKYITAAGSEDGIVLSLICYNQGATGGLNLWKKGIHSTKYSEAVMNNYKGFLAASYGPQKP